MPARLDITARLQGRLLEIVRSGLPLIASSIRDADLIGLAHLRGEMVDAMDAYCRHVQSMHDTALLENSDQDISYATLLLNGCVSLQSAYEAFRSRWEHRQAVENWYEYRLSAVVMMKHVRGHVEKAQAESMCDEPLAA